MTIHQQRISLKNLKVAEFASEETLCFTATVLFDGKPIADASNEGYGGPTHLRPLQDASAKLDEAVAFAQSLPPVVASHGEPAPSSEHSTIAMDLEFLVNLLADDMHAERKIRASFNRAIRNKALFMLDGELKYLKGNVLKAYADKATLFDHMRVKFGNDIVILNELPTDDAFAIWRHHIVDGDTD